MPVAHAAKWALVPANETKMLNNVSIEYRRSVRADVDEGDMVGRERWNGRDDGWGRGKHVDSRFYKVNRSIPKQWSLTRNSVNSRQGTFL